MRRPLACKEEAANEGTAMKLDRRLLLAGGAGALSATLLGGREAVANGVLGDPCLAFGGARSSGKLRVGLLHEGTLFAAPTGG